MASEGIHVDDVRTRLAGVYSHIRGTIPILDNGSLDLRLKQILKDTGFNLDEAGIKERFARLLLKNPAMEKMDEEGVPWRVWRTGMAGQVAVLDAVLAKKNVEMTEDKCASLDDSRGILKAIGCVLGCTPGLIHYGQSQDWVIQASAAFYGESIGDLSAASFETAHWRNELITESGLGVFRRAVLNIADPLLYLKHLSDQLHYVTVDAPDEIPLLDVGYSLSVQQLLERLSAEEEHFHFTWNQTRRTLEFVMPRRSQFYESLNENSRKVAQLRKINGEWWTERTEEGYRFVIPTAPFRHFRSWEFVSSMALQKVDAVSRLVDKLDHKREVELADLYFIKEFSEWLARLYGDEGINAVTRGMVNDTPEASVVSAFIGRFNNIFGIHYTLSLREWHSGGLHDSMRILRSRHPADWFDRLAGGELTNMRIPLSVTAVAPGSKVIPLKLINVNRGLDALILVAAYHATAPNGDGGLEKVVLRSSWDPKRSEIVIDNPDGRFARHLAYMRENPRLHPLRFANALKFPDGNLTVSATQIYIPIHVR